MAQAFRRLGRQTREGWVKYTSLFRQPVAQANKKKISSFLSVFYL